MKQATSATITSENATLANFNGSVADTVKSNLAITCVSTGEPSNPMITPMAISHNPCPMTIRSTSCLGTECHPNPDLTRVLADQEAYNAMPATLPSPVK
jgi:hypothetical protein